MLLKWRWNHNVRGWEASDGTSLVWEEVDYWCWSVQVGSVSLCGENVDVTSAKASAEAALHETIVQQRLRAQPKEVRSEGLSLDEPWVTFGDLSGDRLADQKVSDLRKYASRGLGIVGSSKLRKFQTDPQGKEVGLVARIIDARKRLGPEAK